MSRERQARANDIRLSGKCNRPVANALTVEGVSIYKVSQWLGQRSVNTTMIYAHLAPQDDEINKL